MKAVTSSEILSLSLRPRRLSELVGQKGTVTSLQNQIAKRPPSAFLFYGPSGCGKTTLARIAALSFQCEHQKEWGEPCDACWNTWTSFAIHEVNASDVNGVEEMRKVADLAAYRPTPPSKKRVIILDECQMVTTNGQNLLLKHFEDCPKSTVWIICTTAPAKILATLRRRCVAYQVRGLGVSDAEEFVQKAAKGAGITKPLGDFVEAALMAQLTSPAMLLMALEKYGAGASIHEALAGTDPAGGDSLRICKAVTSGEWDNVVKVLSPIVPEEARWVRSSVAGWLKGILVKERSPKRQAIVARSLEQLMAPAPLEDANLFYWLWAVLHKITGNFSPRKPQ